MRGSWVLVAAGVVGCTASEADLVGGRAPWGVEAEHEPGRVVLRSPGASAVSVALTAWGSPSSLEEVRAVEPEGAGERTVYAHPGLAEWWERGPAGLEQGFTVEDPPPEGELVLELALDGAVAEVDADGRSATWLTDGPPLRYEGLAAWDEVGARLPSRMEATPDGLRLVVDVTGAVGLVVVDPVFPAFAWSVDSNQATAWLGDSVAGAGDVNGDGFDDVMVGAFGWSGAYRHEGRAEVYLGSAAGLRAAPAWQKTGRQNGAFFGTSVASAGDVNGDGFDDVIVASSDYDDGEVDEGGAAVWHGSRAGLAQAPAWTTQTNQVDARLGAVASAGDVNGDGFDDVIVGAYPWSGPEVEEGMAAVYLGSARGLRAAPAWTVESDQPDAHLGVVVASAGDVNGDGFDDVLVGVPGWDGGVVDEGAVRIYAGSAAGPDPTPTWTLLSGQSGSNFGISGASAGDVNGDGFDDVVVGITEWDGGEIDEGAAWVYLGSPTGPAATPDWSEEQDQAGARLGTWVASAGDVNADGYDDLVVGAEGFDDGETDEGVAFVYVGSRAGLRGPVAILEANQAGAQFGESVASAGDVDGNGADDVIVGGSEWDTREGTAKVYLSP